MKINTANELSIFVKNERKQQQRTQSDVSSNIGMKQPTLSAFEKQSSQARVETLFKIIHELGLELHLSKVQGEDKADTKWTQEW